MNLSAHVGMTGCCMYFDSNGSVVNDRCFQLRILMCNTSWHWVSFADN